MWEVINSSEIRLLWRCKLHNAVNVGEILRYSPDRFLNNSHYTLLSLPRHTITAHQTWYDRRLGRVFTLSAQDDFGYVRNLRDANCSVHLINVCEVAEEKKAYDITNNLPKPPERVEVGQVWCEDGVNLWKVLPDNKIEYLKFVGPNDTSFYSGYAIINFSIEKARSICPERWVCLSLSTDAIKNGQLWYNRETRRFVPRNELLALPIQTENIHLVGYSKEEYDSNYDFSSGLVRFNPLPTAGVNTKQQGEESMTHKITAVTLKPIDPQTIQDMAGEIASVFGYVSSVRNDGKVIFRKEGSLVGSVDVTPESLGELFKKEILAGKNHVMNSAIKFGIVKSYTLDEVE